MHIIDKISYIKNYNKLKKIKLLISDVDGVMTDGRIIFDDNGVESKFFNTLDGMAISYGLREGLKIAILTGSTAPCVVKRFERFSMLKDIITHTDYKLKTVLTLKEKYGLNSNEIAYIGDDFIDLAPMKYVALSFAPRNAVDDVRKISNIVLTKDGGFGAVRLAIDMILKAQGKYENVIKHYITQ